MERKIFVSADLGNSHIMLMAAERNEQGLLHILGLEQVTTPDDSIQNGVIKTPTDVANQFNGLVLKLQNRLTNLLGETYKIKNVYMSTTGRSLRTNRANVQREFSSDTEISSIELASLRKELENNELGERKIYEIFEEEYGVDGGQLVRSAEGRLCKNIRANYLVVSGRPDLKENLRKCTEYFNNVDVDCDTLAPLAIANAVTTNDDRQNGCAVLNFGAATTTVAVYQGGYLRHMCVIPFGGKHITDDVKTVLDISQATAEKIKTDAGTPKKDTLAEEDCVIVKFSDVESRSINLQQVSEIIEARLAEIVDLCMTEIKRSKYDDRLSNGIIVTGGASKMCDFIPYLEERTEMPVKTGSFRCLDEASQQEYSKTEYALLIGLLKEADYNCVEAISSEDQNSAQKTKKAKKKRTNVFRKISDITDGLFSGQGQTIED